MSAVAIRNAPARRVSQSLSRRWVGGVKPLISGDYTIVRLPECYLLFHRSVPLAGYTLQSTAKIAAERHGAGYSIEFAAGGWK